MNKNIYSTILSINELFEYVHENNIEIYNIQIEDKIIFCSISKFHHKLIKNKSIQYLYTTHLLGMLIRFFKIEKVIPLILSILILLSLSNMIFEIEVLGESIVHHDIINKFLNVDKLPLMTNKMNIMNKMKELDDELDWYEVIQKGSKLYIHYFPRIKNNINEKTKYNLISSKDAIIASFDVLSGNKIVKVNQKVNKGDLLISQYDINKSNHIIGKVYGYTFKKIDLEVKKNRFPTSIQKYILLLKIRMNIELDEDEYIVKEISLQFEDKRDTIRIVNFYVLYEMISIVGENNE